MSVLPDLQALRTAADAVDRTAVTVESDAASVDRLVDAIPWRGPLRNRVVGDAKTAVGVAHGQAAAERELARALRQLSLEVERELAVLAALAALAARARRHLEDLLHQAQALVSATADAVANAAAQGARILVAVVTADPTAALREARQIASKAVHDMQRITVRLHTLPEPHDPAWRRLGPEILGWRPL